MLDQTWWNDAKRIFDEALALDPALRDAYLSDACRGNVELLNEVRSLLTWHDDSVSFLETPVGRVGELPFAPAPDPLIGQSLGVWRIVDVIGRGGMGVVYRAERADDAFQRQAALKVVRRGAEGQDITRRFRRERETLAALDHPNIARLLDGGSTEEGDPYFVMEYVDGQRVDDYCDRERLTIDERLRLFVAICRGVQYAHQNFVVHRDLKPDNILVSHDGVPKLLDFGIARLLGDSRAQADDASTEATWLMTPDFASPEQLSGRAVTAATDVYSLGVLLHVLLTGDRPYRLTACTRERLQSELSATAFTAPSVRIAAGGREVAERAAARATTAGALAGRLSGDLDAIVTRAGTRDVNGRYATVEQLIDDLERHRTGHVVQARVRTVGYVASRFIRRNRFAAGVAAGVVLLASAGVAGILWQASLAAEARARAERRFDDVRQLAHAFMFDVHDQIANLPGSTRAREIMVGTASRYLEGLAREAGSDAALQQELATAFVKLGDAQGHPNSSNIGDTVAARASYERAIALAEAVLRAEPDDRPAARTRAMAHRKYADVLAWTGDLTRAEVEGRQSRELFQAVALRPAATAEDQLQAAIADIKLGDVLGSPILPSLGRRAEALQLYERALQALQGQLHALPGDQRTRRYVGIVFERIGTVREHEGQWDAAADAYRESFAIRQALAVDAPLHTDIQRDLAVAFEKIGNVELFMGDPNAAAASYRGALDQFERLLRADTSNATAWRSVAIAREHLAAVLQRVGNKAEAGPHWTAALNIHLDLAKRDAGNVQAKCDAARVQESIGDLSSSSTAACPAWSESLQILIPLAQTGTACASADVMSRIGTKLKRCG